ncbi:hypothetical protein KA107_00360 [Candidatus Pacearchaeota archaeon]|nr:hypothetical protein [Candidatus Pacearchaeota archaeon]
MSLVFLTGLPGSGKTFLARAVSERYSINCYDSDYEFNRRTGLTISQLVSAYKDFQGGMQRGWEKFRELESEIVADLCKKTQEDAVISLGGGVIAHNQGETFRQANIDNIRATRAPIVYLTPYSDPIRSAELLVERKIADKANLANRPDLVLNKNTEYEKMKELAITRTPIYLKNSHAVIYTESMRDEEKIELIAILGGWRLR